MEWGKEHTMDIMVEHLMEGEMQIEGIVRSDKTNTAISDLNFKKRKHNGKVK